MPQGNTLMQVKGYLLGAWLLFLNFFGCLWIGGDTSLSVRFMWALVFGGFIWIALVVPHLVLQLLILVVVKNRPLSARKRILMMNVPVLILILCSWIYRAATTQAADRFEEMVFRPLPKSVNSVEQAGVKGMDFIYWFLRFRISLEDLEKIVSERGFVREKAVDFPIWEKKIKSGSESKFEPKFDEGWQVFRRKDGREEERIFFYQERGEAIFVRMTGGGG